MPYILSFSPTFPTFLLPLSHWFTAVHHASFLFCLQTIQENYIIRTFAAHCFYNSLSPDLSKDVFFSTFRFNSNIPYSKSLLGFSTLSIVFTLLYLLYLCIYCLIPIRVDSVLCYFLNTQNIGIWL